MNGCYIGGPNPVTRQRHVGVWGPNDPALKVLNTAFPTSGLIHYLPLTADANDDVGDLNLTNNNSVAFSATGARFDAASSRYLSATKTWSGTFTWVIDALVDVGGTFIFGAADASTGSKPIILGLNLVSGKLYSTISTKTDGSGCDCNVVVPNITDGKFHTVAVSGSTAANEPWFVYYDGVLVCGKAGLQGATMPLSTAFAIGRFGGYAGSYSSCYARDFRAYNRVLTSDEILRISV